MDYFTKDDWREGSGHYVGEDGGLISEAEAIAEAEWANKVYGKAFEPSKEELDFLNKIDGGYVGITRPKVDHLIEHFDEPGRFEDSDNDAADPEQAWA